MTLSVFSASAASARHRALRTASSLALLLLLNLLVLAPARAQKQQKMPKRNPINAGAASYKSGIANHTGYDRGVGLRVGGPTLLSLRVFRNNTAVEGLLGVRFATRGLYGGGLLEQHFGFANIFGLRFFVGLGAHVYLYQGRFFYLAHYDRKERVKFIDRNDKWYAGIAPDVIAGAEYQFMGKPLTIGADIKPCVEWVGGTRYFFPDPGVTVRYLF